MATKKITPKGGIKVIVQDSNGQPRLLGTIPVWENPSPAQRWVMENPDSELTTQLVYVKSEEEFSMESEVKLKASETKTINSKFTVKIREV